MTTAIEEFAWVLDYLNPDHAALTWDGALDVVIAGKAAFTSMGDWAWGNVVNQKVEDQIGYVTHPGTDGAYVTVVDGFTMPKGAPDPINAANWLRTVGSISAQETFAPYKGCIPARTDIDTSKFTGYFTWSIDGLASVPSVPSMAHGRLPHRSSSRRSSTRPYPSSSTRMSRRIRPRSSRALLMPASARSNHSFD